MPFLLDRLCEFFARRMQQKKAGFGVPRNGLLQFCIIANRKALWNLAAWLRRFPWKAHRRTRGTLADGSTRSRGLKYGGGASASGGSGSFGCVELLWRLFGIKGRASGNLVQFTGSTGSLLFNPASSPDPRCPRRLQLSRGEGRRAGSLPETRILLERAIFVNRSASRCQAGDFYA